MTSRRICCDPLLSGKEPVQWLLDRYDGQILTMCERHQIRPTLLAGNVYEEISREEAEVRLVMGS